MMRDAWIAEGVHLAWTGPLTERADLVVWLDYESWRRAAARIVRRFLEQAVREARSRPLRERFTRFRDYARHLRSLVGAIAEGW